MKIPYSITRVAAVRVIIPGDFYRAHGEKLFLDKKGFRGDHAQWGQDTWSVLVPTSSIDNFLEFLKNRGEDVEKTVDK